MTKTPATSAARRSPDLYPPAKTPEIKQLIDVALVDDNTLRRPLRSDDRRALQDRRAMLSRWAIPATPKEIKSTVARCFLGMGGAATTPEEAQMVMAQYVTELQGLPAWAIERACSKFARGEVRPEDVGAVRIETGLRPSTAHIRIVARDLVRSMDDELRMIGKILRASDPIPESTAEDRSAVARRAEAWRKRNGISADEPCSDVDRRAVLDDLARRMRVRIQREYEAAGLPVPEDAPDRPVRSLSLLLSLGAEIIERPDGSRDLAIPKSVSALNKTLGG